MYMLHGVNHLTGHNLQLMSASPENATLVDNENCGVSFAV